MGTAPGRGRRLVHAPVGVARKFSTSREGRRGVPGRRLVGVARNFFRYQAFLTLRFWQIMEAKSKTMVCWVRSRPLLPTVRMVSFSFSTIDYKSLTYARGFAAYNRFPSGQKQSKR